MSSGLEVIRGGVTDAECDTLRTAGEQALHAPLLGLIEVNEDELFDTPEKAFNHPGAALVTWTMKLADADPTVMDIVRRVHAQWMDGPVPNALSFNRYLMHRPWTQKMHTDLSESAVITTEGNGELRVREHGLATLAPVTRQTMRGDILMPSALAHGGYNPGLTARETAVPWYRQGLEEYH